MLPITGELLRGSLLERVVRHKSGCPKCARGEGHQVYVLTVGYGRGQTRQISVRKERVAEVRPLTKAAFATGSPGCAGRDLHPLKNRAFPRHTTSPPLHPSLSFRYTQVGLPA